MRREREVRGERGEGRREKGGILVIPENSVSFLFIITEDDGSRKPSIVEVCF